MRSASGHDYKSLSFQICVVSERRVRIFGPCLLIQPSDTLQHSTLVLFDLLKMQAQCHSAVSQSVLATRKVASLNTRALPARSRAFSSHSTGFTTGQALCARPMRRALSRSMRQAARADIFFTQKTVPDQTRRVAIVTGTAGIKDCSSQLKSHLRRTSATFRTWQAAHPEWVLKWQSACLRRMLQSS